MDPDARKEEPLINVKIEEEEENTSSKKNSKNECGPENTKYIYHGNHQNDGGNSKYRIPSSSVQSYRMQNTFTHSTALSNNNFAPPAMNNSNIGYNRQMSWNLEQGFPNFREMGLSDGSEGPNLQVQHQMSAAPIPGVYKPVDHDTCGGDHDSRRFSNDSMKMPRRGSNTSVGSMDSSYHSGNETTPDGRRGSNNSIHSFTSCGRSANMPSPLPSRNLSPRRITETVIEGEVLHNYDGNNLSNNSQNVRAEQPIEQQASYDNTTMDGVMHSRISSGYGSQTTYFPTKSPNSRLSPTPPSSRDIRRASEGTMKRVGDTASFNQANQHTTIRRASEPYPQVSNIIEDTPRRHSMSTYSILPIPETMESLSNNNSNNACNNITQQQQTVQPSPFTSSNLVVTQNQPVPSFVENSQFTPQVPVVYRQADSTSADIPFNNSTVIEEDTLSMFVDDYMEGDQSHVYGNNNKMGMPSNPTNPMLQQHIGNMNEMMNQQIHSTSSQLSKNTTNRLSHLQPIGMNDTTVQYSHSYSNMVPHPPNTPRNATNGDPNYAFTVQWQNNHFGPQKSSTTQMREADSTEDKDLEDLMVNGMAALNTVPPSRPHTNMAINRMDTLLCSFTEENKFFEGSNRYD